MRSSLYPDRSRGVSRQHRLEPPRGGDHVLRSGSAGKQPKTPRRREQRGMPPRNRRGFVPKVQGSEATKIGHRPRRQRPDARDGREFIHPYPYAHPWSAPGGGGTNLPVPRGSDRRDRQDSGCGDRPALRTRCPRRMVQAGAGAAAEPSEVRASYSRSGRVQSRPRAWWSIKPMTVSYQRRALFGLRTQWFSSGK